jgi:ParB-like chromosome segregation protein Spo0J
MAGTNRKTAKLAAVKDWRARALRLHIDGFTMREIAVRVGKALSTVHEGIEAELAAITGPIAEEAKARRDQQREVEGARLEAIIRGHMNAARKGDADAAHVVITAVRQRGKLFGLEAPNRTELTGRDGGAVHFNLGDLTDDQIDRLAAGDTSALGDAGGAAPAAAPGEGREATSPDGARVEG